MPPGFFGDSLGQLAHGRLRLALMESFGLALFTAIGLLVAYVLLHALPPAGGPRRARR